ncbi:Baseplate J-like protein [Sporomusa ovata DSM 2662]|uniref:Baseplate protein J-like barrel domain-containing protein n=1 Tax=Sporomusa ovata TaxID=2378 RepID=A0A0U1KWE1_9FIRM|nr:baseplate J/gp47 family protein [Sporomusa ovata]EQB28157.1 putative phage Mu protein gp47-like protein [Sporomusa ovata DSM 2662]CQR71691.1 FIG00643583: hypothetical protein [Sporomusa ovata]
MAYFTPYIDSAGLHIPTYTDIRDDLIEQAKSIYGQDIYLENDSMDYQYLSVFALKISDTLQAVQLAYNNRSPSTSIGSALDAVVKINGIYRKMASYSTCSVTLMGTSGTLITDGIVQDASGYNWSLPASVTISNTGSITVTATCQTIGAISAQIGDITKIITPTKGWISVTNNVIASTGQAVEVDSALRSRQAISTENPSQTILDGIFGAISSLESVTRLKLYENDTGEVDADGLPPHSLTAVVEGGKDEDIANAIYVRKTPGAYTNGTTALLINNDRGQTFLIRFYRPAYVIVDTTITLKALAGYTTATTDAIKAAVANYQDSLQIGDDLSISSTWGAALSVIPSLKKPLFSITSLTIGRHGQYQSAADIVTSFNEVTQGDTENIVVNIV